MKPNEQKLSQYEPVLHSHHSKIIEKSGVCYLLYVSKTGFLKTNFVSKSFPEKAH